MNLIFTIEGYIYYVPPLKRYFNRKQFERFLIDYIVNNNLYHLSFFYGGDIEGVRTRVKNAPYRTTRIVFGDKWCELIKVDIARKIFRKEL